MKKISLFIGVLICFYASVTLQAQNPASINVSNLSDQQIQKIVTEVNARGLTIDQGGTNGTNARSNTRSD